MTIRYQCEECGAVLNIKDELAGSQGHCPRCQVEFSVPAAAGSVGAEQKPATFAGKPAVERRDRSEAGFNEDDIGDILASEGPVSSTAQRRDSGNGFDEDEEPDDEPRKKGRKPRHLDDASEAEHDESADDEADGDSDRGRKKKGTQSVKAAATTDAAESASIARNLMGRGEHAAVHDEKKAGRPFGGTGGRGEERPDYTSKDIIKHFASIGWPAILGLVLLGGLCYGIMTSLMPSVKLPPLAVVTGTITLDGKPPRKDSIVRFQPAMEGPNPNLNLATSFGFTDENGKYSLVYLVIDEKRIAGAVIGKHLVTIQVKDELGGELLPLKYSNTSQSILKAEVVKGGPPINFDLKSDPEASP